MSVVFSNDASIITESRIFCSPKRVMPKTVPLNVITSASCITCRMSIARPYAFITCRISWMIVTLAASMPSTNSQV